jgi:hypothetical protein
LDFASPVLPLVILIVREIESVFSTNYFLTGRIFTFWWPIWTGILTEASPRCIESNLKGETTLSKSFLVSQMYFGVMFCVVCWHNTLFNNCCKSITNQSIFTRIIWQLLLDVLKQNLQSLIG